MTWKNDVFCASDESIGITGHESFTSARVDFGPIPFFPSEAEINPSSDSIDESSLPAESLPPIPSIHIRYTAFLLSRRTIVHANDSIRNSTDIAHKLFQSMSSEGGIAITNSNVAEDSDDEFSWKGQLSTYVYDSGSLEMTVENQNEYRKRSIWNFLIVVDGALYPDRVVMLNSQRDSMGPSITTASGNAIFVEILRGLGKLMEQSFQSKRTLVFASWDAQDYGSVGSTLWATKHELHLRSKTALVLNIDSPMIDQLGTFFIGASPQIRSAIYESAKLVYLDDPPKNQEKSPHDDLPGFIPIMQDILDEVGVRYPFSHECTFISNSNSLVIGGYG